MTPNQIMLVRTTFASVLPIAEAAAAHFYTRLFELDPSLRPMFTADMEKQGQKLMQMIAVAVRGLDDLETLIPTVRALGQRHAGYGVQAQHYETVAVALLDTLECGLGAAFAPEARQAWTTAYWLLAQTMTAGAAEPLRHPARGRQAPCPVALPARQLGGIAGECPSECPTVDMTSSLAGPYADRS